MQQPIQSVNKVSDDPSLYPSFSDSSSSDSSDSSDDGYKKRGQHMINKKKKR